MIIKSYETKKINSYKNKFFLFYGENEGHKSQIINSLIDNDIEQTIFEEKEILDNPQNFLESTITGSLFSKKRVVIIKRATDKILTIVNEIYEKNLEDISIILNSGYLEKRSKLRIFFEKNNKLICIAFYPDDEKTLSKLTIDFFKEKKIKLSYSDINMIVNKSKGNRLALYNDLEKIEYYGKQGKKITKEKIAKLTSLFENHSIAELVDNCFAQNKKKIINILNQNYFTNDDCILIVRSILNKSKKILKLATEYERNKNIDLTISSAKPPIFWKEKEITKQHIFIWKPKSLKALIFKISEFEILLKKNIQNQLNLTIDFLFNISEHKS